MGVPIPRPPAYGTPGSAVPCTEITAGVTSGGRVDGTVADTMATAANRYGLRHTRNPTNTLPAEWPTATTGRMDDAGVAGELPMQRSAPTNA